jgi:hypothetical protein
VHVAVVRIRNFVCRNQIVLEVVHIAFAVRLRGVSVGVVGVCRQLVVAL